MHLFKTISTHNIKLKIEINLHSVCVIRITTKRLFLNESIYEYIGCPEIKGSQIDSKY